MECEACKSEDVAIIGSLFVFLLFFIIALLFFVLGFMNYKFWFITGIALIVSPVGLLLPSMVQCKKCKYTWIIYKENK